MKIPYLALAFVSLGTCWAQIGVQIRGAGPLPGGPFNDKVVTGKPFTADAILESKQTLADGTHITNTQTISVARDSQGRTRRDETLPSPAADGQPLKTIMISDPVAQVNYVLGPDKIARKFPFSKLAPDSGDISISTSHVVAFEDNPQVQQFKTATIVAEGAGGMPARLLLKGAGESTTDALGTQTINGVLANGTRTTRTIPAGQIGNDSALVITSERWYSDDLHVLVMSTQTDPRFGESSFQLSNIQRTEPATSMFQVPSDYTIEEPR
jgi:hypothetical protein